MQKPLFESSQDITYKYFLGKIIDNNDPLSKGRVRVEVDGMTKDIPKECLPWYAVINTAGGNNNSSVAIPSNNSRVLVTFPDGDIYNGIVQFVLPQNIAS